MEWGDPGGGSTELARLIDQHGECIVSDFLSYYNGLDLADVLIEGSGLTPRRAIALIRNLPVGSPTIAALRGGEQFRDWDLDAYMTANLLDAVNQNTFAFVAANSKRKPKAPKPFERPVSREKQNPTTNQFAAMARIAHARSKRIRKKTTDDGARRQ